MVFVIETQDWNWTGTRTSDTPQCIGVKQFSNSSALLTISFAHKTFGSRVISLTNKTDTHTHRHYENDAIYRCVSGN